MLDGSKISSELPNMDITAKKVVVTLQAPCQFKDVYIIGQKLLISEMKW